MSSISGVSSSTASQAVRQNDPQAQQRKAEFEQALLAGGADSSQVQTIQSQIQQAIADAVRSGGTTNSQRPNPSTIKDAVDGVLKANGIDVTKFSASLDASKAANGSQKAHRHGGHHKAGTEHGVPEVAPAPIQDDPAKGNQIDTAA
ncbi:MAG: hypothetical protein ACREJD_00955 [Phycisphaerales bacterium]